MDHGAPDERVAAYLPGVGSALAQSGHAPAVWRHQTESNGFVEAPGQTGEEGRQPGQRAGGPKAAVHADSAGLQTSADFGRVVHARA